MSIIDKLTPTRFTHDKKYFNYQCIIKIHPIKENPIITINIKIILIRSKTNKKGYTLKRL